MTPLMHSRGQRCWGEFMKAWGCPIHLPPTPQNIELKVEVESLKRELQEKQQALDNTW